MKIIIIGGGVGLSAYHAPRKHLSPSSTNITLYEAYPPSHFTTTVVGGGLGLHPNGQRAIAMISQAALQHIQSRGQEYAGRDKKRHGYGTMMAPRASAHEDFLMDEEVIKDVKWGKGVKDIKELENKVEVHFEDGLGGIDNCDLLIVTDGVRSVCKEALSGKEYPAEYDGLTGIGGFLPLTSLSPTLQAAMKQNVVTITYRRSGFFGLALCTPSPSFSSSPPQQGMW
ncbi:hypothetical protein V5O48_004026 [Marasmius crinis-equi]|uniref:Uncharacterized protein n=1 Tax=Marasmius crinis-equi TaxID=585013 RepID=A0ABR3FRA8_9AGAR